MSDDRPNADQLLVAVQKMNESRQRGQLRVFLGMCPGVGKTFAMLKAAHEAQKRGRRVTIGVVETHGRIETQDLVQGLVSVPLRQISYKNSTLAEMDLDQILKEKPDLVLVDELAHTNASGSRHIRRYQDVEEILSSGIDVYTTVNIQHVESRNDQVAQITGVKVRETVPDSFFEKAQQIEVVDLSPDELLRRLKEGKVYLGERAERAEKNFFKLEYLTALREMALRFIAERVDHDLKDQMVIKGIEGPWNTKERLLVAVSYSPYSARLIRATARMSYNLEANWVALYVESGDVLNEEDQDNLRKNLNLVRELGGEIITLADSDISRAIQKICREKNITQIIMGRPDRRFLQDLFSRGTLLDRFVRSTSNIDVHVIRAERAPRYRGFHISSPEFSSGVWAYWNVLWFLTVTSFLCYALLPYVGYRSLGSIFLLAILLVSSLSNRGPIFFAALISAFVWNFFFIPPQFTFIISSWEDSMMVLSFFVAATVGGWLTSRIRKQEMALQLREERTLVLYELSRRLADAKEPSSVADIIREVLLKQFQAESFVLIEKDQRIQNELGLTERDFAVATWAFEQRRRAGWSTQTLTASNCLCLPLQGQAGKVGVVALFPKEKEVLLSIEQEHFLDNVINQCAIAIERLRFIEAAGQKKLLESSEKLHQTLMNSVSHELRTPITAIIGTSTALKDEKTLADKFAREALTTDLIQSAQRLDRVVENLLDMSRLEKGTMQLKKEWFEVHELIDELKSTLRSEEAHLTIQGETHILLKADFRLLQHAIYNLLVNALKYSRRKEIAIVLTALPQTLELSVIDNGPGVPAEHSQHIFEKFYRLPGSPAGGIGLGLSIVKSIIDLHGGSVKVENRADGAQGAEFKISLPLESVPDELKEAMK